MGINTDNLGMGLSAILKGVYQVRAIGSGTTPSVFTHTVPASMTVGKSYQVAFSGVTSAKGAVTYTLALPANQSGMIGFSKGTGILADENITVNVHADTAGGTRSIAVPGNYSLEVLAYAGQTLVSTHTVNFTLVAAVLTGTIAVSGASGTTNAGGSASFSFSGVTANTGTVTYSIANSGQSYFTFSKSTNIAANEAITVTAAANTPTGTYNFTISANTSPSASNGPVTASCSQSVTAAVVTPTMSGTIQVNIPSTMTAGATGSLTLSGVTSNIGTPTYSISEQGTSYFTFSKTSGITAGENVSWSLAAGAPTGTVTFNISANTSPTASNGPMTITHTFQVTGAVVTPTMSGSISHDIPSTATAASNYDVHFSGKSATSGLLYSVNVNSGSQYVSFSKTSGIKAGENVIMSVASNAPNGGGISGTISANTSPVGASNGPDSVGFSLGTLAIVEPDPSFSGFNHTVPANTQQGQSYTVTFSGTSSSNGHQVWYSLSPQTGLSFSKLDNISSGEAVTLTIGGSATGTLAVTVYANTTKNDGSTFTQSVSYIQTTVAVPVPVTMNTDHLTLSLNMVSSYHSFETDGINPMAGATYSMTIGGATSSDGRTVYYSIVSPPGATPGGTYADMKVQGVQFTFVGPDVLHSMHPLLLVKDSSGNVYDTKDLASLFGLPSWGTWEPASLPLNVSN